MITIRATGRSGRLWLRHRLETAQHGAALLERKQLILSTLLIELERAASMSREEWVAAAREAATWLARAGALDGQHGLTRAQARQAARISVTVDDAMGVAYPAAVDCQFPTQAPWIGSSALVYAIEAHRRALACAARHAAALRAVDVVVAERANTRLRQQAIQRRLIPALSEALARIQLQLDELEREEELRMRWAIERPNV